MANNVIYDFEAMDVADPGNWNGWGCTSETFPKALEAAINKNRDEIDSFLWSGTPQGHDFWHNILHGQGAVPVKELELMLAQYIMRYGDG